ncbi:uncharacterized protein LOC100201456 isoform X2 [Hydra vulgaris]|uniref:Uncharacterized protein LOC100201456 isoform X2 n=1 Tax=Hydra vulgaris TaxID=6087 RepID=A0ABM4BIU8_HYDVU
MLGEKSLQILCKLVVEWNSIQKHFRDNTRQLILCTILSITSGFVLLIAYFLIYICCLKLHKNRYARYVCTNVQDKREACEIEDGEQTKLMIVSAPVIQPIDTNVKTVVIDRSDSQTFQNIETETFVINKTKNKKSECTLISAIRRSHSIDEGTQTDHEETELLESQNSISAEEQLELSYLVETMNFYNNRLSNDFNFEYKNSFKSSERDFHSLENTVEPLLSSINEPLRSTKTNRDSSNFTSNLVRENFNS